MFIFVENVPSLFWDFRTRDHMMIGLKSICETNVYHHLSCKVSSIHVRVEVHSIQL
jgi:hypothetical protein